MIILIMLTAKVLLKIFFDLGPNLPYIVKSSAMVSTDKNGVFLVGGEKCDGCSYGNYDNLVNILALTNVSNGWREKSLSDLYRMRKNHIALSIDVAEKVVFCGKTKYPILRLADTHNDLINLTL